MEINNNKMDTYQDVELTNNARFYHLAGFRPLLVARNIVDYWQEAQQNIKDSDILKFDQGTHYRTILDYYFQIVQWLNNKQDFLEKLQKGDSDTLDILWIIYRDVEVSARTIRKKSEMLRDAILKYIEQPSHKRKVLLKYETLLSMKTYHTVRISAFLDFLAALANQDKDVKTIVKEVSIKYNLNLSIDFSKSVEKTGLEDAFWNVEDLQDLIEFEFKENLKEKVQLKEYMESLEKGHHNSHLKPFLIRTLELKRWNYGYLLKDFLSGNIEPKRQGDLPFDTVSKSIFYFYHSADKNKYSMHIDVQHYIEQQLSRRQAHVTENNIKKGIFEILKETAKMQQQLSKAVYEKTSQIKKYLTRNSKEFQSTNEQLIIDVFETTQSEVYELLVRKLWNGTFGVFENNKIGVVADHTVQKDVAANMTESFKSKMLKIVSRKDSSVTIRKNIKLLEKRIERYQSYLRALTVGKSLVELHKLENREKIKIVRLEKRIESNEQLLFQFHQAEEKGIEKMISKDSNGLSEEQDYIFSLDFEEEESDAEYDEFNVEKESKDQDTEVNSYIQDLQENLYVFESLTLTEKIKLSLDTAIESLHRKGLPIDGNTKGKRYAFERDFLNVSWEDILSKYEPDVDYLDKRIRDAARQVAAKGRILIMEDIYIDHEPVKSDSRILDNIDICKKIISMSKADEQLNMEVAIKHSRLRSQQYPRQKIYNMLTTQLGVRNLNKIPKMIKIGGGLLLTKLKAEDKKREEMEMNNILEKIQKKYNYE